MRSVTAGEQTVLQGAHYATHVRVQVEDADGAYQDITDPWLHSGRVSQDIDQIVTQAEVLFWRDQEGGQSLAPLDEDSTLNRNAAAEYAPLIDVGRGIRVDVATVAHGTSPGASDWQRILDGNIDAWDCAESPMRVVARDAIGKEIADRWIEEDEDLGSESGDRLEDVMQHILDRWTTGITLYVPTATLALVPPYWQRRQSVMDALLQLAATIGWVIEPRWDDGTSSFRLTLYEPDRTPTGTDWTWAANRYSTVPEFSQDMEDVRNAMSLWYTDTSGVRQNYTVEDSTSIAKYGRQWMEIEEPSDSPIDTLAEAQALLDNALLDLKDPPAAKEIRTFCFWPVQLGDNYAFTANSVHYTANQEFGVTGFRHEFGAGHVDTFLRVRGKPAGFTQAWLVRGGTDLPPGEDEELLELFDVEILYDTPSEGQATIQWQRGARVYQVWYYTKLLTQPIAAEDDPWPPTDGSVTPTGFLDVGTDSIVVSVPDSGDILFVQLEPRSEVFEAGTVVRIELHPKSMSTGDDLPAGSVAADKLTNQAKRFHFPASAFSAVDDDTVQWTSGTLTLADGTTYAIGAGNTGAMTVLTYVYFDATVSTTAFQVTTDLAAVLDDDVILMAVCDKAPSISQEAFFVPAVGIFGLNRDQLSPDLISTTEITDSAVSTPKLAANSVTAAKIGAGQVDTSELAAGSVSTDKLQANSVTAAKINVASLSAISADVGTLTAGLLQNAAGTRFIDLDASGSEAFIYASGGLSLQANGNATFFGDLSSATGSISGVTGTFSGDLQATTISVRTSAGTLRGSLSGSSGTLDINDGGGTNRIRMSASGGLQFDNGFTSAGSSSYLRPSGSLVLGASSGLVGFFNSTGATKRTCTTAAEVHQALEDYGLITWSP